MQAQGRTAPVAVRDISVRFEHLSVADGLSQTTIYAIHQDRFGFMWFATQDGLNRFDGHSMKVYRHEPFDSTGLGNNTVVAISEDRDGNLWVGTGRGVYRMNRGSEKFTAFRNDPNDPASFGSDRASNVLEDRNGTIWVATQRGLDRLDKETGTFTHYRNDPSDQASISHNVVFSVYEDLAGHLWAVTANGLNRMHNDLKGFDRFLDSEVGSGVASLEGSAAERVLERPEEPGILWVATHSGLLRFDPETGETDTFEPTSDPNSRRVADLVQDPVVTNVLWLAVPGTGLVRFDIRTGGFTVHGTDPTNPRSLSTTNTERIFGDRSGMLWVGVNGVGVDRFNPAMIGMSHFRHDPGDPQSLPGSHVRGIHQDMDGGLWVGTRDRRGISKVSRFDPTLRTFRHIGHRPDDPTSLSQGIIRAILEDRTGALWVGVGTAGLDRMARGKDGSFQHFRHDPDDPASLSHRTVRYLLEDHSGAIWVATNGGLDRLVSADEGTFQHYRHDPDDDKTLTGNRTSVLFESAAGFVWVGADGGLNRLDPLTGAVTRYQHDPSDASSLASDGVMTIHERSREPGIIWVGTFGGGLSRLDVSTGVFETYTERNGLPNNAVYGILEDEQGRLWMSTNGGLARFNPETGSFRRYGLDVGLQSLEFNSAAFHKGLYGEMFFGGVNGLNAFFPDELTENATAPEVVIVDIKLSHQSVKQLPGISGGRAVPAIDRIQLHHDQSDLTFDFVALHFQNPSQNAYAYRLDGYDGDWIEAGSNRTASYTNLSPGAYTFRVRAANSDGVWNEEGASLSLTIDPPWWQTWWAFAIYAGLGIGAILGIHRVQAQKLVRAERERSRQRELDDAHTIEAAYSSLKATQEQLIQAEKMASLGILTAGIAHEIKNPLNFVNNFSEMTDEALHELTQYFKTHSGDMSEDLVTEFDSMIETLRFNTERVREHGRRADSIVKSMLMHSLSSKSERHPTDLNVLLRDYVRLAKGSYESKYPDMVVHVESNYDDTLGRLEVVPQDMGRVFTNLLNNAFEALHERKTRGEESFIPTLTVSSRREPGIVELRIVDNGPGVDPEIRDKIFNPFFTTREVGEGAGLGLSMSYEIVAAHGGALELDSEVEEGVAFVVRLPL